MPKARRSLFESDTTNSRKESLAQYGLKAMAQQGKAGPCSACKNPFYATLKCKRCGNFYHHDCSAHPPSLYPNECKKCGKLARDNCLFCGYFPTGTCFQCKRGFHLRCANKLPNNHAAAGSCGRRNCQGKPALVEPKPKAQQPTRAPEFSESQLPSTSKRSYAPLVLFCLITMIRIQLS